MRPCGVVAGLMAWAVSSVAWAQGGLPPINVPLTVREWAGVAAQQEPASGGVPIAPRLIRNVNGLCLVDEKGKPLPAQFQPLVTDRDGYVRWVLVDCQLDLEPGQERALTLKTGANPAPAVALQYQRAGDLMQVTTGPMRFAVNTRAYNFLDTVWIDANRNGRFERPERIIVPTDTPNVLAVEAQTRIPYTSLSVRPGTVRFEHRGPLRAVMVMEGDLADDQGRVLVGYRTRITAFAGKTLLLVEHSLRNSRKDGGADVAIRHSELGLGLADDLTQYHLGREEGKTADGALLEDDEVRVRQERTVAREVQAAYQMTLTGKQGLRNLCAGSAARGWVFASSAARGVFLFDRDFLADAPTEVVQRRGRLVYHDIPPARAEPFVLRDLSLQVSRLVLDFAARSADRIEPKVVIDRTRSPLVLLPNAAYVARLGALGGPFATVEDEVKVYREVWQWPWDRRPSAPPDPTAYVRPPGASALPEMDELRDAALELVRTGEPGFYHRAAALARCYAHERAPRTDGFDLKDRSERGNGAGTGLPAGAGPKGGRPQVGDRFALPEGLVDWYCLTGEAEVLEAAVDTAEYCEAKWRGTSQEAGNGKGVPRPVLSGRAADDIRTNRAGQDRPGHTTPAGMQTPDFPPGPALEGLCRVYEATADPRWLATVTEMVQAAVASPQRDERGFLRRSAADQEGRGGFVSLEAARIGRALWRAWEVTGNEDARDFVVAFARLAQRHLVPPTNGLVPMAPVFGVPKPDSGPYDDPDALQKPQPHFTVLYVDGAARGYHLTGDPSFLAAAKAFWTRGARPAAERPGEKPIPNQTGAMLHETNYGWGTNSAWARLFFYHLAQPREDAAPPKPVTDLAARPGPNKRAIYLTWTAPEDLGGGEVAVYQVKRADLPIVDDKTFDYAKDKGKRRSWWFAANLADEPAPGKPGSALRFLVKDLPAGTHYFALKSRDDSSNESPLSNVVTVEIK